MTGSTERSIRQPLLVYGLIFMGTACFATLTMASVSSVATSRRAYDRALRERLEALARLPRSELRSITAESNLDDAPVYVLREHEDAPALTYSRARALLGASDQGWVVVQAVRHPGTLLAARADRTIPTAIAFAAISRLVPLVLLVMLGLAGLMALMVSRLLLPPLDALAVMADQAEDDQDPLSSLGQEKAPNEIVDVAQRFRRTVRRLRSERERIREQKDELERMQESLIRASKLAGIGRLAAGVAHEVGNPLAAVRGYMALLDEGLDPDEASDVVARSRKELERIHDTIRGLLTYARSSDDGSQPCEPVDLRSVVDEAVALARGHPSLRRVHVDMTEGLDAPVLAQPSRLKQVVLNLLLNGAQAMEPEGGSIRVGVETAEDARVALHVDDEGPGVPESFRESIFDPFFTTKDPGEGTGLGLSVSRALVEGMGGNLSVGSAPSGGARFTTTLRRA